MIGHQSWPYNTIQIFAASIAQSAMLAVWLPLATIPSRTCFFEKRQSFQNFGELWV